MNPRFLNTVLLGGTSEAKLRAVRAAGFDECELWTSDVDDCRDGAAAVKALSQALELDFTDYQVLLDFEGAPAERRTTKRAEALTMLDTAAQLDIATVLVPASTDPECDRARTADDLAWLVGEAKARGRRIAYEGMAWSVANPRLADAWAAVRDLDPVHAGLVVDAYHLFVGGEEATSIDVIPNERIFLVQFSDVVMPVAPSSVKDVARHARLLPGQGTLPLKSLATRLLKRGYRGPIGLEVFNDAMHRWTPDEAAREAAASLDALMAMSNQSGSPPTFHSTYQEALSRH